MASLVLLVVAGLGGCGADDRETVSSRSFELLSTQESGLGYNIHLENVLRFEPIDPDADPEAGRALFGVHSNMHSGDPSGALFEGFSIAAGREIESNGRTCFTCHRGESVDFGLPKLPLSAGIPSHDPLFTGINADAQGDPDALHNLDMHGLIRIRPNRFNQARSQDDPFRQIFFWRKSPALINVAFSHGLLLEGRGRTMLEANRGAIFSHTQSQDDRFDDLFSGQDARDLLAFQFGLVTDNDLLALLDPSHPMHHELAEDPFATVDIVTPAQVRGREVFVNNCMICHDTPNVFNNRANVAVLGTDGQTPEFPVFAPSVGRSFNIGISERNKHGLRFTRHLGDDDFEPIEIPLANEDGSTQWHTVTFDIGLAATTGRAVDIGRFKVPQLRNIRKLAPYFHDNSASTLEEVVDYFNSDQYENSKDGQHFPIDMTEDERADLLKFLKIL